MYFAPLNYWPKRYWPQGYWPNPTPNTVTVSAVALSGVARVTAVVPGSVAAALAAVYGTLAAEQVVIVPGDAAVALDALAALLVARTTEITGVILDHTILLEALGIAGAAQSLYVRPGAMVVGLQSLTMSAEVYRLLIFTLLGCAIASAKKTASAAATDGATAFAVVWDRTGCQ